MPSKISAPCLNLPLPVEAVQSACPPPFWPQAYGQLLDKEYIKIKIGRIWQTELRRTSYIGSGMSEGGSCATQDWCHRTWAQARHVQRASQVVTSHNRGGRALGSCPCRHALININSNKVQNTCQLQAIQSYFIFLCQNRKNVILKYHKMLIISSSIWHLLDDDFILKSVMPFA